MAYDDENCLYSIISVLYDLKYRGKSTKFDNIMILVLISLRSFSIQRSYIPGEYHFLQTIYLESNYGSPESHIRNNNHDIQSLFRRKESQNRVRVAFGFNSNLNTRMKIAEFANSVDLDEMAHNEPPHLDLRCLLYNL